MDVIIDPNCEYLTFESITWNNTYRLSNIELDVLWGYYFEHSIISRWTLL